MYTTTMADANAADAIRRTGARPWTGVGDPATPAVTGFHRRAVVTAGAVSTGSAVGGVERAAAGPIGGTTAPTTAVGYPHLEAPPG
ncbi:MAG: hypothetical protein ACRCXL_09600 [Dermatophilaceae bacterium]